MLDKYFNLVKPLEKYLNYPKEYNPKIHGPYNPSRYYGKPDPLLETKIGDLGSWFSRRSYSLSSVRAAIGRSIWRYKFKYILPKRANAAFIYHTIFFVYAFNYILFEYPERKHHTWAIYH